MFEAERPHLVPYVGPFDGFHSVPASVSKTCTVRFDTNKYSVMATAVGRPVDVHAYADRIVIRQDGVIVGEHTRAFGRGQTVYDPWHYVPVLARKPGALRNGAPFRDWVPPQAMAAIRRKLKGSDDGDRQMVQILTCVRDDGLQAVEAACREALDQGVHSAPVIINILGWRSVARDWAAEQGYDRDLAEIALAHVVGSDVERAYRRGDMLDRRRAMAEAWAQFLTGGKAASVVPFPMKEVVGG